MSLKRPDDELLSILDNSVDVIVDIIDRLARAKMHDDQGKEMIAFADLQSQIANSMILGDLLGRRRVLLEADYATKTRGENVEASAFLDLLAATTITPTVPNVSFAEAVKNILDREPRLEPDYLAIQQMYQTSDSFAAARSTSQTITERLQQKIASFLKEGVPEIKAKEVLAGIGDFSKAYAGTVFRTNANTAYTRGRFQESRKPGVRRALPVFEFAGPTDIDARDNHRRGVGFMAKTTDPVWENGYAPPLGYG